MKQLSKDVTRPDPPVAEQPRGAVVPGTIAPNSTVPRPLPPIDAPIPVSGVDGAGISSAGRAEAPTRGFTLPDKVPASQVHADAVRYGTMGRRK